jgi:apolipoprotein D and lipocalin family protein
MKCVPEGARAAAPMLITALLLCACRTAAPPLPVMPQVDVPRFMGDWYVIASIPTRAERDAYAAVESYRLDKDGRVLTTFTFHRGGFAGPLKRYTPVGFVTAGSNGAVWGMRFLWPFRADYRVMYVDGLYTQTLIGREKRDYAWLMARTPSLSPEDYQKLTTLLAAAGYDLRGLRRVPQPPAGH